MNKMNRRAMSFLLALAMFVSVIPSSVFTAFAADEVTGGSSAGTTEQETAKNEYEANVGKQAIFAWWANFDIAPEVDSKPGEAITVDYESLGVSERVFTISDYYYAEETASHWYKLAVNDGGEAPEQLKNNPWVLYTADTDIEKGYSPYLCVYSESETIRFVTSEHIVYKQDEEGNVQKDEEGNPIVEDTFVNYFVIAGPSAIKDAVIEINRIDDHPISALAYVETTYDTFFKKGYSISIKKSDDSVWTPADGSVSIRYEAAQFGTDDCSCGAGFLYIDGKLYSAASTDRWGYEESDLVYTNSGSAVLVFEIMSPDFEWIGYSAHFANDSVTLYDNNFAAKTFVAANLPTEFDVAYAFTYAGEAYYWLEHADFIGSPYFLVKAENVTLGELPEEYGDGRVSLTDKDGNAVNEITLPQYQKPEFTAVSSLTQLTADVDYQWQIEYEDGKWVDIYGEDDVTIKLSFGMVATLLNDDGKVNIRCETKSGSKTAYSAVIPVTLEMYVPEEPDVVVSESFQTSTGETVTVTVAGTIPEDASVELKETDSTGVDVAAGETVVAPLDISIKNADGSEWQPESGESVTVQLEASKIGLQEGDRFVVYHLHNGEVQVLGTYVVENDTVTFAVDGFSKFVFALAAEEVETPDFSSEVGKHATLTRAEGYIFVVVLDAEPTLDNIYDILTFDVAEFPEDTVFSIDAYKVINEYYDIVSDETGELIGQGITQWLWYQVSVVEGECPEDFEDGYWILQNYLTEADALEADTLTLFVPEEEPEEPAEPSVSVTVDGEEVTEITVSTAQKVTLTATPNVEGTTTYQWQILIPTANMWVNMSGQTTANCVVYYGMVANGLDSEGKAHVRCVTTVDGETITSEPIAVNIAQTRSARSPLLRSSTPSGDTTEGEGSTTIYNVVIQYVFADGRQAANPWTATIEAGGDFKGTIKSPTVVGYTPDKTSIDLDIQDISSDLTYTVTYYAAEVKFTVVHKFQNVDNEDYSEFKRVSHFGYTDSAVGSGLGLTADEMTAEGVYDLPYDIEQKIAADGSTEVVIFYDRYYFLMTFDLGGGYGVEPIYARVETPITVGTPIRAGYAFTGWSPAVPERMPAEDMTITAQWTPGDTTYTVVYWAENANDNNYSFWAYKELGAVSGTTVSGSDDFNGTDSLPKTGFHFDHADQNVTVKGDGSTVVNVYYKRNTYNLIFAYSGGPEICGGTYNHSNCKLICGMSEHAHSSSCCDLGGLHFLHTCNTNNCEYGYAHTHSSSCYDCGKVAHTSHSVENGCYGMKFEGIKYGQDTSAWWSQAPAMKWLVSYRGSTFYTAAPAMPNSDLIIYGTSQSGSSTIHYYEYKDDQQTTIKVRDDYVVNTSGWSFTSEDYIVIPGFTYHSSKSSGGTQYYIYYTRNSYTLTFKNGSETKDAGTFLYQADISGQYYVPTYNGDDPDGFTFAGWYTTEACVTGTEWHHTGATMPFNNLILYAKWAPVSHEVKLYKTKADWEAGNQYLNTMTVQHNTTAQEPARPGNGSYNFVGWFYMEDGVEKAYDFDIPVRKDLNLYGKWVADELATYTIKYAVENADGSLTYIADDTNGSALAGQDKTFEAKSGTNLYKGYQTGYYPETSSHSMNILLDADNTYTFIYVPKNEVKYTVKYLEKGTETVLATQKNGTTREAVHTENFVFVSGHRPDAYQKRIVLSANEDENVIIFWYEVDTTHAPVLVKHYLQNAAGTGYNKTNPYLTTTDLDGVINSTYNVDIITTLEGFEFAKAEASYSIDGTSTSVPVTTGTTQVSAVVTQYGLLIELYYDRVDCPYEFKFLEQGTDKVLADSVTGTAIYGSQVTQPAKVIPGYKCTVQNQSMTIQLEDGTTAVKNVRIFYYVEETVGITYVPVINGTTTPSSQTNIPVLSGTVGGSTATPNTGYEFKGWFKDQSCTIPVDPSWVSGNKITPDKTKAYGDKMGYESATYYAKFEEIKVTINYVPVGNGTTSSGSETLGAATGTAYGSVAAANKGYQFVGWYSDEACTKPVTYDATNNKFVPSKVNGLHVAATYYAKFEEIKVTINYVPVGPEGATNFGSVDPTTETVGVISGTPSSTATASSNVYKFVGWFYDEDCTKPVNGNDWINGNTIMPQKNADGLHVAATYYAKFEFNLTSLTITKTGHESIDPKQTFLFEVVEVKKNEQDQWVEVGTTLTVTIHEDGAVTIDGLTVGSYYRITEKTDWSWRYQYGGASLDEGSGGSIKEKETCGVIIQLGLDGTITFINERPTDKWLDGDDYMDNVFKALTGQN